jgi:flagellar hook-associated protein 1 FlgK
LRQQVLSTGATLAADISNAASSVQVQRASLDQQASGISGQVNALTSQIAQLNLQIQSSSPTGDAGILEDQRQQALSNLSQLIGINQIPTEDNGLSITTTSGQTLVSHGSSYDLTNGMVGDVDIPGVLTALSWRTTFRHRLTRRQRRNRSGRG